MAEVPGDVTASTERPSAGRRVAAILSILLVAGVAIATVVLVLDRIGSLLAVLALMGVVAVAVWFAITRAGTSRKVAVAFAIAALAAVVAVVLAESAVWSLVLRLVLLVLAGALARYALSRDVRTLKDTATAGTPVPAAAHGALIMNLKSGGGKAERFHLADECRRRDIEPIVLQPDDDMLDLARDAIDRGADVIGMAGGDGSQALVATIAAERDIPMVVIPAGTRNHLALDLGIDRDDVVGALDAFQDAVERPMDLAYVNGHVFVNNVSLGLYGAIVQSPEYRDAKVDTTLSALPKLLGPGSEPMDLRFDGPDGTHHDGAHVVQVSNGPYGQTLGSMTTRPSVETGLLGITTLVIPDDAAAKRFITAVGMGRPDRYEGLRIWSSDQFVIDSGGDIAVGLDGEAMDMAPPLRFTITRHALRVRLAQNAIGYSPAALASSARDFIPNLWHVALGRPSPVTA